MPIKIPSYQRIPYANVERNWYTIGSRRLFFRSKMEANVALYLEFLKERGDILQWDYEPEVFVFEKILFGTRSYRPDFRIVRASGAIEYWECKGYFDPKSKTKLKRMRIYYPHIKIVLIDKAAYNALAKWRKLLKWY